MAEELKQELQNEAEEPKKVKKTRAKKSEKVEEAQPTITPYQTRPAILKDFSILKHIIATEETMALRDKENALVFAVDKKATKLEIKAAVQAIFQAKVKSVNTRNVIGKHRRVGRYVGKLPDYKKAIIRFDSSFDLGKIQDAYANEERQANSDDKE